MSSALGDWDASLRQVALSPPTLLVVENRSGRAATGHEEIRQLLLGQLTRPVAWVQALRQPRRSRYRRLLARGTIAHTSRLVPREPARELPNQASHRPAFVVARGLAMKSSLRACAAICLFCALSGCAKQELLWYGHDAERSLRLEIRKRGKGQWISAGKRESRPFEEISIDSFTLANRGPHFAFAAMRRDVRNAESWYAVLDLVPGPAWDGVAELTFAPRGGRFAYAAERRGKWRVLIDGRPSAPFAVLQPASLQFSANGERAGYVVVEPSCERAVVDNRSSACHADVIALAVASARSRRRAGRGLRAQRDVCISPLHRRTAHCALRTRIGALRGRQRALGGRARRRPSAGWSSMARRVRASTQSATWSGRRAGGASHTPRAEATTG